MYNQGKILKEKKTPNTPNFDVNESRRCHHVCPLFSLSLCCVTNNSGLNLPHHLQITTNLLAQFRNMFLQFFKRNWRDTIISKPGSFSMGTRALYQHFRCTSFHIYTLCKPFIPLHSHEILRTSVLKHTLSMR